METQNGNEITIICGDSSWKLDRAMICRQSEVISRELKSGMQESSSKIIRHTEYDADTLGRMVSYVLENTYEVQGEAELVREVHDVEVPPSLTVTPAMNEVLKAHVRVHAIADYYELVHLRTYAFNRFATAAKCGWHAEGFTDLVREVYRVSRPNERDLLDGLSDYAAKHRAAIMRSAPVMSELGSDPELQEFLASLYYKSIRQEILDRSRMDQTSRTREHKLQAAEKEKDDANKNLQHERDLMKAFADSIPSLPGMCSNDACSAEFPACLTFVRGFYPDGIPRRKTFWNNNPEWWVKCARCDTVLRYGAPRSSTRNASRDSSSSSSSTSGDE